MQYSPRVSCTIPCSRRSLEVYDMRRTSVLFIATTLVFGLAGSALAQKRSVRGMTNVAKKAPSVEVSKEAFTFSTQHEAWALGDPEPTDSVIFDGSPLSLKSRRLTKSTTSPGVTDITFPVGDYIFYEQDGTKVDVQSVVGRYERGKLTAIYVFYKPQTVNM